MSQFTEVADQLAAHIRNPSVVDAPNNIEQRRLKIYQDLFYKNIEGFASGGFPVLRSLIADEPWHAMVRDFMVHYRCHTPYFLEISQEFLAYLGQREAQANDLPFMVELAHYEWVELALDVAPENVDEIEVNPVQQTEDLLTALPVVSPLAWSLAYHYPVHHIGPNFQPEQPGEQPTYLVVYRNRQDKVGFMEANAVTARLLELLQMDEISSGKQALEQLGVELQHPHPEQIIDSGHDILKQLYALDILLGTVDKA